MTVPTTDLAFAAGEAAPDGLEAVGVTLALELTVCHGDDGCCIATDNDGREHGPLFRSEAECQLWIERKPAERRVTYWVGLDEEGCVNVDAAKRRAEADNPGYEALDAGAA